MFFIFMFEFFIIFLSFSEEERIWKWDRRVNRIVGVCVCVYVYMYLKEIINKSV